ncbi:hypothetical protein PIB30_066522 [Stylosanthes scabra]|uniref:Uncharacterized protein n=1 Tax=Stylosanthes scabra TaxID=79078 RepID=A0ABU6RMN4_9FABA|nr:hypothetical protein [Stylosanthes scabra]
MAGRCSATYGSSRSPTNFIARSYVSTDDSSSLGGGEGVGGVGGATLRRGNRLRQRRASHIGVRGTGYTGPGAGAGAIGGKGVRGERERYRWTLPVEPEEVDELGEAAGRGENGTIGLIA